jgi:MFS family permease
VRKLWKDRNARWYLSGQSFSLFGDTSLWLALAIWVKELTGSAGAAGLTFFFFSLSAVISPFAGMVVDRVRRRTLLIWTNVASAGVVLALFGVQGRGQVWLIYLVMFLYGVSYAFLGAAQSALLKVMLPEEALGDANGALQTVRQALRLVAPLVGAGLFAVAGGRVIATIDAVTFLVAAATLLKVHVVETRPERGRTVEGLQAETEHWWAEITAGARYVWRTVVLRQIVAGTAIALLVFGFFESIDFAIVSFGIHKSPTFLGVMLAVQGLGAIVGGPTAAPLMRRIGPGMLVGVGILICAVCTLLEIPPSLPAVLAGMVLFGLSLPWIIVGLYTLLQLRTPNELQGRVYSAADTVLSVPQTVSIGVGAALVGIVNYRLLLVVISAVLMVSAAYLLTRPEQRQRPEPDVEAPVEAEVA